jgi:uncharacterized membrane protein YbhN (UPF0104 family)
VTSGRAGVVSCTTVVRWVIVCIILAGLAVWALASVGVNQVARTIASADAFGVFVAMPLLLLAGWALRAARWIVILRAFGIVAPVVRTYLSIGASLGLAAVTPVQAGELLKVVHLRSDHGVSISRGVGGFAAERFADIVVLAILTLFTSSVLFTERPYSFHLAVLIALAAVVGVLAVRLRSADWLPLPGMVRSMIAGYAEIARKPALMLLIFASTFASWVLTAKLWQVSLATVGVEISMVRSVLLMGFVTLATVLSFLPGGAGVSEIAAVVVLAQQGYTVEQGVVAALILRFITILAIVLGLVHGLLLKFWTIFLK